MATLSDLVKGNIFDQTADLPDEKEDKSPAHRHKKHEEA